MFQINKCFLYLNIFFFLKKKKKNYLRVFLYKSIKNFYLLKQKNSYLAGKPKNIFLFFISSITYVNTKKIFNFKDWFFLKTF